MEPIKVLVCQTCGDEGFTNAFIYCVKCLEFVIHRYCLKEIPKTYTERVIWYCESCQPTVENEVTSLNKSSESQKKETKKNIDPISNRISYSENVTMTDFMHNARNHNVKAVVNLKGSGCNIWETFEVLKGARREIFKNTVFGYLLDVPQLQGDGLLFHKMFLHQIQPDAIVSPDGIKRLYFRVGDTQLVYGPEEFCLITGFNFGSYPRMIGKKVSEKKNSSKKRCLLRERLFPNHTNSSIKISDLKSFILNHPFLAATDDDVVRACLIYILCEGFLGKEINDRVQQDWFFLAENLDVWNSFAWGSYLWEFTFDDLEDTWTKINKYLSLPEPRRTFKYSVSGFTAPFRIWIYEMLPYMRGAYVLHRNKDTPRMKRWSAIKKLKWVDVNKIFDVTKEKCPPRHRMTASDEERRSSYYFSCQQYVSGAVPSIPSPVWKQFRRQEESSSSLSSSGRSDSRARRTGKPTLEEWEELASRIVALEQEVYMNRQHTEVNMENVDIQNLWDNKIFDEPTNFEKSYSFFDDGLNTQVPFHEEKVSFDEVFDEGGRTTNNFDEDVFFYDNEAKPPGSPRRRNKSQFLRSPFTQVHTAPKPARKGKKKVDTRSTPPLPPPVFSTPPPPPSVLAFSALRLQPYVAGGEAVIEKYFFHAYEVRHRFYNLVLGREFWGSLFGHTGDGWLDETHITIWLRLLMERRFDGDRYTIMPPQFFVCHALEDGYDWSAFMSGRATYPNIMVAWWDVDRVYMPIHSYHNHWLFGELRLESMEVHIYDSLGRNTFTQFESNGTFTKFEAKVAKFLDKTNYWRRRNLRRTPLNMTFTLEDNVPQQSSHLGDCGVFVCMFMEQLISGQPIRQLIDPKYAAIEFRQRMAKIFWGSCVGPV